MSSLSVVCKNVIACVRLCVCVDCALAIHLNHSLAFLLHLPTVDLSVHTLTLPHYSRSLCPHTLTLPHYCRSLCPHTLTSPAYCRSLCLHTLTLQHYSRSVCPHTLTLPHYSRSVCLHTLADRCIVWEVLLYSEGVKPTQH